MSGELRIKLALTRAAFTLDVDLALPATGFSAVFGASGAGKTLLLRSVAGLERARDALVAIDGEVWQDSARRIWLPPHRRALGYVFQDANLFAHLDVRGNLDYARRRADGGDATAVIELLDIGALLARRVDALSGGERQRVAIARALLSRPKLLLFDEPLAAVDLARRAEILPYLERLRDTLKLPALYVTHQPDEAARLADRLVLLEHGRVRASGALPELMARRDLHDAFGDGVGVVVEATFVAHDAADAIARLAFDGGELLLPLAEPPRTSRVRCRIEARDVSLTLQAQGGTSILNILPATVRGMTPLGAGAQVLVELDVRGTVLLARITRRSWETLGLDAGRPVFAQIKAAALIG